MNVPRIRRTWVPIAGLAAVAAVVAACVLTRAPAVVKKPQTNLAGLPKGALGVRTIDVADEDFSDLVPLAARLKDVRVIALGEATHGDGTTFAAKARLIRYLHERLGFDIIAWEAGMYDCERMDAALRENLPTADIVSRGLFGLWADSDEVRRLFNYAREHPMTMAGFDSQFSGADRGAGFGLWLFAQLDATDPHLLEGDARKTAERALERLPRDAYRKLGSDERSHDRATVEALLALVKSAAPKIAARYTAPREHFLERVLSNVLDLYAQREQKVDRAAAESAAAGPEGNNARDAAMADNLLWLMKERYPDRKIIVWSASFHAMRDARAVDPVKQRYASFVPMGSRLSQELGAAYYAIAFTAYQGTWGRAGEAPQTLVTAMPEAIESKFHAAGHPYVFLDFHPSNGESALPGVTSARFLGYSTFQASWDKVFDAMFFSDTTEAPHGNATVKHMMP